MRLVVGMSGASGAIYGIRLLEVLKEVNDVETQLIMSPAARQTIHLETDWDPKKVEALADEVHVFGDIAGAPSSGSFRFDAMAVVPCSMRTVAAIAYSLSDNLLVRAADVALKERRTLLVAPRETPLHLGHLRAMTQLAELGALVVPPMPAFYHRPQSIDDLVNQTVNRICDLLGIFLAGDLFERWQGAKGRRQNSPN
ncbi:MAG: UbiX family flavin prenyltransferase [Acidimicrobiales bacterium]